MTFKIRKNAHFAPTAPTGSGQLVDMEDVKASFDYYEKFGNRAADMFNSRCGAPLLSVTTPDSTTLVLKMKQPDVVIEFLLGNSGYVVMLAKEGVNGEFDLRAMPHGSGPLYVKEHQPSAFTLLEKNPQYHLDGPFIGSWQWFYIKEYASLMAQFRGGNVYTVDVQDLSGFGWPELVVPDAG